MPAETAERPYVAAGGVVSLSGAAVGDLLSAVVSHGASFRFRARGVSMRPFIQDGDVLTIGPVRGSGPRVGDVVAVTVCDAERADGPDGAARGAARLDDSSTGADPDGVSPAADCDAVSDGPAGRRLIVHRVVARRGERFQIRGDNCLQADGWFPRLSIAGVVTGIERDGRRRGLALGRLAQRVAWLSGHGRLTSVVAVVRLPRRAVGGVLRSLQRLRAYRCWARRFGARVRITEAADADLRVLSRRFGVMVPDSGADARSRPWGSLVLVARFGDTIVGFVDYVHRADDGPLHGHWLYALTVWTPCRGMGVATRLLEAARQRARQNGATELLLAVDPGNQPAMTLYRKLGFTPVVDEALAAHYGTAPSGPRGRLVPLRLALPPGEGGAA